MSQKICKSGWITDDNYLKIWHKSSPEIVHLCAWLITIQEMKYHPFASNLADSTRISHEFATNSLNFTWFPSILAKIHSIWHDSQQILLLFTSLQPFNLEPQRRELDIFGRWFLLFFETFLISDLSRFAADLWHQLGKW